MIKFIVPIILVISYFYIAIWVYENINEIVGIVIGIGVVGIIIEILWEYFNQKNKKE